MFDRFISAFSGCAEFTLFGFTSARHSATASASLLDDWHRI